jgi:hypothetical protein
VTKSKNYDRRQTVCLQSVRVDRMGLVEWNKSRSRSETARVHQKTGKCAQLRCVISQRKRLLTRRLCHFCGGVVWRPLGHSPLTHFNQNANHSINADGQLGNTQVWGLIRALLQVRAFAHHNFPAQGVPSSDSRKFIKKCHCGLVRRSQIAQAASKLNWLISIR